jgi:hypothetical protein
MRIPEGPHSKARMLSAEEVKAALVRGCERAKAHLAMLIEFDNRPRGNGSKLVFKGGV